jgi:hypothetical protein
MEFIVLLVISIQRLPSKQARRAKTEVCWKKQRETCREVEAYMAFTLLSPLYRIVKVSKTSKGTNSSLKKV